MNIVALLAGLFSGIIGSMEVNLALRYLLSEDNDSAGKIFVFDGNWWETLIIKPSSECKICKTSEVKI